jgi:hypothetical protein
MYSQSAYRHVPHLWLRPGKSNRPINVDPGQPVCVRVAVPPVQYGYNQSHSKENDVHRGSEMDSLIIWVYNEANGTRKVLKMNPWSGYNSWGNELHRTAQGLPIYDVRIYEAEIQLYDSGEYAFDGIVEKRIYGTTSPWRIQKSPHTISVRAKEIPHKWSAESYLKLPLCYSSDNDGRWVSKVPGLTDTSTKRNQKVYAVQRGDQLFSWIPYNCKHDVLKFQSLRQCLIRTAKRVHWYVDQEDRGLYIRKLWSYGRWCSRQDAWRKRCACADLSYDWDMMATNGRVVNIRLMNQTMFNERMIERNGVVSNERVDSVVGFSPTTTATSRPDIAVEDDPSIVAIKFGGLLRSTTHHIFGRDPFEASYAEYLNDRQRFSKPNLVIIGFPLRDIKALSFEEFDARLTQLIEDFKFRYRVIPIIYKSFRYSCCGKDGLTSSVIERYEEHTRKRFVQELNAEVWDTWIMGKDWATTSDYIESQQCPKSHAISQGLIDVENHVLLNAICNQLSG